MQDSKLSWSQVGFVGTKIQLPCIHTSSFYTVCCEIGSDILSKYPWVVCERWWDGGIFWWWYPGQQLLCSYDEPDSRATANGRLGFTKVKKKLTCLFDENIFCKTNNKVKRATGPKYEVRSPTLLPVQILSFVKPKVSWSVCCVKMFMFYILSSWEGSFYQDSLSMFCEHKNYQFWFWFMSRAGDRPTKFLSRKLKHWKYLPQ